MSFICAAGRCCESIVTQGEPWNQVFALMKELRFDIGKEADMKGTRPGASPKQGNGEAAAGGLDTSSLLPWLVLNRVPFSAGSRPGLHELLEQLGPDGVLDAGESCWRKYGIGSAAIAVLRDPPWTEARADQVWAGQPGVDQPGAPAPASSEASRTVVHYGCELYPPRLREIADPPLALFVQGCLDSLTAPQVAIVGSRRATPGGGRAAFALARDLAGAGICVTSGLAVGIDASAHQGALAGGGFTNAVMGTGPDRIYPSRHAQLSREIARSGALVSEFAPGTPPSAFNFPRRNRIISALALGVVVVEAAQRSGSLITARLAGEQGREVFAMPGSVNNPMAAGCHGLIRQGATLATGAQDVIAELAPLLSAFIGAGAFIEEGGGGPSPDSVVACGAVPATGGEATAANDYTGDAARLLGALAFHLEPFDDVIARSGLTPEAASSVLLTLELDGMADTAPGGFCCRVR